MLRNDVDNDISRQSVEESLRGTDESQDGEKVIAQSSRGVIEETGDSWLRQASENKARSRAPRMEDVNVDARVSVTLQESENEPMTSTTSMHLKPTTMRGIPLASLTLSPIINGFYITKSEIDLPSSTVVDNSTPFYMTDTSVEQETTLISDISTTDETVTVAHNDRIESGPDVLDDNLNDISDKVNSREEQYSTPSSSVISSKDSGNAETLPNYEKSDLITIPVTRPASKRRNSLRYFDHTTSISNSYVSSTTPTRRRIAHVVSRYTEATTPLWTGRRIVAKKRSRTTISPIKDAIKRTESAVTSTPRTAPLPAKSASTLTSRRRKLPTTSIPSIVPDSTPSPEILAVHNNLANFNTKTEDPESHATEEVAMILTNSVIAATPSITKIISMTNGPTTADISMLSDEITTMMVPVVTNASVTSPIAIAKAPTVTTDATITTSAVTSMEDETTSLNYSVTDNPTIDMTNAIPTDSTATIAFTANTESEIFSTNINTIPETAQTIAQTDSVTKSDVASTETIFIMTNYSTIAVSDTTDVEEIAIDSANTTTVRINVDIGNASTTASYSVIPTTTNMHDVISDATSVTAASAEVETTSMIGNYSTFTIMNTTIPVTATTSPLTTVISSTVNTQHIHATAPMTTNDLADANTVTANVITTTTPLSVIIPITDLNVIMTSTNANIPSTSATSETSPTTAQARTSSVTSSETPITSTVTSANSAVPPVLTTEFSTNTNLNKLDANSNSEVLPITATAESTEATEIPTTFETSPIFSSTVAKPLHSTNFEASPIVTAALSIEGDKSFFTPKITQNPSTLLPIFTSINKATVALKRFTSATPSTIFDESITTNPTIQTTTNAYDVDSVRTISEVSTMSERKTGFKETTSTETQSRTEDQFTTINEPSSTRTTSEMSTTPKIKTVSEEVTSKTIKNRRQNQTTSELDTTNYQFNQKTARRRVLNRTNNWLGSPSTLQRTNQYPRNWVAYRGQSRRPPTYISSSKNHRRRIIHQRRTRVNSAEFNIRPDQDTIDIQNTTEDHVAYDKAENERRTKVEMKKIKEGVEEETTTVLPEETTIFLQSSITIENETLQVHLDKGNIEEKEKIIPNKMKQSHESFITKETSTNSTSSNENLPDNSQNSLHVIENLSKLERSKQMKTEFENVRSQSEEKNPIEGTSIDSDSINTNLQNNFSKNSYADKNLSDKRITGRRMRVILKSVRPKSEEKNSTIEETSTRPIDKNLQNNLTNNVNISQNFSTEGKTRRRMRVVLKRVKSESDEGGLKTEEASTEHDSTNESLQGTFSNNFYSAKNFPIEYRTRRRMRVVLKSIKPKSEEKNLTVEQITVEPDSNNKNLQDSSNFRSDKNFSVEYGTKRRMRVALKSVKFKSEKENSTIAETSVNTDKNTFLNNSGRNKNLPVEYRTRRRMRVILKNVKPKSEERNSTIEETSVDSDSTDKDLHSSFSSNLHTNENLSDDEEARRRMKVALKSVKPKSEEIDSVAEETSADSDFARKDPQVLYTFHFSSNLHVDDNLDEKKKHPKPEEREAMTERPEDTEPQITRTSVPVEEDTDQPSLEVSAALSRRPTLP